MEQKAVNPLRVHFRQPAIYLKLPSRGQFWTSGLDMPTTGELPVFPMTARDEILLRTPDALLNGQGVVDVIQSCCPNITDAWHMPSVDVDAVLVAVRIASFGNTMNIESKCPHCGADNNFESDLGSYIDNIRIPNYNKKLEHGAIRIKLKPQTYLSLNETNKINYEEQRVLSNISNDGVDDEVRLTEYKKHLDRLVELNAKVLVDNTEYIEILDSGTIVSDPEFIKEFYFNCDADICKELRIKIDEVNSEGAIPPQTGSCSACEKTYEIPLTFDYSNFFGKSS